MYMGMRWGALEYVWVKGGCWGIDWVSCWLVFSCSTIGLKDSLQPSSHGMNQSLIIFLWDLWPFLLDDLPPMGCRGGLSSLYRDFQLSPDILNRIEVWRHSWPHQHKNPVPLKKGHRQAAGMLGIVIWKEIACKSSSHKEIQNPDLRSW